jgi:hypothetical protein
MSEVKIDNRGVPAVSIIDAMSEINADKIFNEESGRGPGISERIGERRLRSEKRSRCHNPLRVATVPDSSPSPGG